MRETQVDVVMKLHEEGRSAEACLWASEIPAQLTAWQYEERMEPQPRIIGALIRLVTPNITLAILRALPFASNETRMKAVELATDTFRRELTTTMEIANES